jgi:hypothetical protein
LLTKEKIRSKMEIIKNILNWINNMKSINQKVTKKEWICGPATVLNSIPEIIEFEEFLRETTIKINKEKQKIVDQIKEEKGIVVDLLDIDIKVSPTSNELIYNIDLEWRKPTLWRKIKEFIKGKINDKYI